MKKIGLLKQFLKGNGVAYVAGLIFMIIGQLLSLANTFIIGVVIDSVIGEILPEGIAYKGLSLLGGKEHLMQNLWICGLVLVLFSVINGIFMFLSRKYSAIASEGIAKKIRMDLYEHIQNSTYLYNVNIKTGDMMQRCTSDLETVRNFLATQFQDLLRCIVLIIATVSIMSNINTTLTLAGFSLIPFIGLGAFFFFKYVSKMFLMADEAEGAMSTVIEENLSGMRIVRSCATQSRETEKFIKSSIDYRNKDLKITVAFAWYWGLSDAICQMQIGIVLVTGIYLALRGDVTVGMLTVFMTYVTQLIWPIRGMGRVLGDMGKANVALGRIKEVLDAPREPGREDAGLTPKIQGSITFENVSFGYTSDKPVLEDISFEIEKGKTLAILGRTGSGKSTLLHLLVGLLPYKEGSIKVDDVELSEINKRHLRKNIGIVLQEPFLFSKTIKDNISDNDPSITDEDIQRATTIASVDQAIKGFEKGYETMVGEKGVTLSGGQKQRVAIARTLINNCKILIFDDSLSAVDMQTDKNIRNALRKHCSGTTTILISHRINTLRQADLILVMEDGHITDRGTHNELIQREGLYKQVYDMQSCVLEMEKAGD
ncbi:MAG: ABC transporter ATP-binding protein [Clostridia bacterium]|nr:ABC transporter ATP-binding protein [Clostridia bacterium]